MSAREQDADRVFRVLCARALQRHGKGFPSTEQEIEEFEASYSPTEDERKAFAKALPRILDRVHGWLGAGEELHAADGRAVDIRKMLARRDEEAVAMAARGGQVDGLSQELADELEQIAEESEELSEEQEPEEPGGPEVEGGEG